MKTILKSLVIAAMAGATILVGAQVWPPPQSAYACEYPADLKIPDEAWQQEPLNGSDQLFLTSRGVVDERLAESNEREQMRWVQAYRRDALDNPKSAEAVYKWAYAALSIFSKRESSLSDEQKRHLICSIYEWMAQPASPRSYEYTRVRFIMGVLTEWYDGYSSSGNRSFQQVKPPIAKKLVQHFPNDLLLKRFAIHPIRIYGSLSDVLQAHSYAEQYRKAFPKQAESYWLLWSTQNAISWKTQSSSAIDKAIAYARQYQKMFPPDSPVRQDVEKQIASREEAREQSRKEGKLLP